METMKTNISEMKWTVTTRTSVLETSDDDRSELYAEQNAIIENAYKGKVLVHFFEDDHYLNEGVQSLNVSEILTEATDYLAIKDGYDVVKFDNGNLGVVAYYNGNQNGFEIIEG